MTVAFNKETGALLKEFRNKHNVTATVVANKIEKTNAYISKLEKGDFKSIDIEVLQLIVNAISNNEQEKHKLIESITETAEKLSLTQVVVNKIADIEAYKNDYNLLIDTMNNNLAITENVLNETKENAINQLESYKNELIELIKQISLQ